MAHSGLSLGAVSGLSPAEALNNFSAISLKLMQIETIGWFVMESLKSYMRPQMLPAMVFLAMTVLAFAAGSSWGIFAVTIPIVISLAYSLIAAGVAFVDFVLGA